MAEVCISRINPQKYRRYKNYGAQGKSCFFWVSILKDRKRFFPKIIILGRNQNSYPPPKKFNNETEKKFRNKKTH